MLAIRVINQYCCVIAGYSSCLFQLQQNEEAVVASQPQTTTTSEAEISREQRGSQEPSSEFALRVAPFESSATDVTESDSRLRISQVDSSQSAAMEGISQSTSSVQSQEEDMAGGASKTLISSGSGLVEGERLPTVVVGIVEPERADQTAKSSEASDEASPQVEEDRERVEEQAAVEEEENREAIGETREEKEEEVAEEEEVVEEEAVGEEEAKMEQADTTQRLDEGTEENNIHGRTT